MVRRSSYLLVHTAPPSDFQERSSCLTRHGLSSFSSREMIWLNYSSCSTKTYLVSNQPRYEFAKCALGARSGEPDAAPRPARTSSLVAKVRVKGGTGWPLATMLPPRRSSPRLSLLATMRPALKYVPRQRIQRLLKGIHGRLSNDERQVAPSMVLLRQHRHPLLRGQAVLEQENCQSLVQRRQWPLDKEVRPSRARRDYFKVHIPLFSNYHLHPTSPSPSSPTNTRSLLDELPVRISALPPNVGHDGGGP